MDLPVFVVKVYFKKYMLYLFNSMGGRGIILKLQDGSCGFSPLT